VIEVIKEVEDRITDVAPKAGAAVKKVTSILTDEKPLVKKATAKKTSAKKTTTKKTEAKKATPKKTATKPAAKKTTAKPAAKKEIAADAKPTAKKVTAKTTAAPKVAATTTEAPKTTSLKVDLKLIEGIGPKLEELLVDAGYKTYADIAKADVADLQKVLENAGSRFKMHNSTSWPLQARFARDGKFEALKSWQEKNNAQMA